MSSRSQRKQHDPRIGNGDTQGGYRRSPKPHRGMGKARNRHRQGDGWPHRARRVRESQRAVRQACRCLLQHRTSGDHRPPKPDA